MRRGRDVIGISVVEPGAGRPLGTVDDILFAPDGRVLALLVTPSKGLVRRRVPVPVEAFEVLEDGRAELSKERFIAFKDARIAGIAARGEPDGRPVGLCGKALRTSEGKELGTIADVVLDGPRFALWGFEVSDGIVMDLLDGRPVVEAAGAKIDGDAVVLGKAGAHMNLTHGGHATSEGSE